MPDKPNPPVTAISGSNVLISWDLPDNRGSPITAYVVKIRESDDVSFTTAVEDCDGSNLAVVSARSCFVQIATLKLAPFNIAWGSEVFAKVTAINIYGESEESEEGNNAIILTVPDAPLNLIGVESLTNGVQIGLTWQIGAFEGGTEVIDYRLWSDQAKGSYIVIAENILGTDFIVTSLTTGSTYEFKVQARNSFDFGPFSDPVSILAAQEPDQPSSPTTTFSSPNVLI